MLASDEAYEPSMSRSHVRIHMDDEGTRTDDEDESALSPASPSSPEGDQQASAWAPTLLTRRSSANGSDADAAASDPTRRRLASARSSAGASSLDELDEEAAITAEPPPEFQHQPSPYLTASFFSRVTWQWLNPLMLLGTKQPLQNEDLHALMEPDQAGRRLEEVQAVVQRIEKEIIEKEEIAAKAAIAAGQPVPPRGSRYNMWRAMWYQFGMHFLSSV